MLADLILHHADVISLDDATPSAHMVAIKGNKVIHVGEDTDIESLSGGDTKVVDCEGATLVPGFNDAHCHPLAIASRFLSVDVTSARGIAEIGAAIRSEAKRKQPGRWIVATGYHEFYMREGRHLNRRDLDAAAPRHPVKVNHLSGHACVLNSLALELAGITAETPEPPGAVIDRDLPSGQPSGLLLEMNHQLDRVIPPAPGAEFERALAMANQCYLSQGITSLQDATADNDCNRWDNYRRLKENGLLRPRLSVMFGIDALSQLLEMDIQTHSSPELHFGGLKILLDETTGRVFPPEEDVTAKVMRAQDAGYAVAVHALEEQALEVAARVLESATAVARQPHRHRIEHCALCSPELLQRLRRLRVTIVTQPPFVYYNGKRYAAQIPPHKIGWLYRCASLLGCGIRVAASSDAPIVPNNPLVGMYAAVARRAASGEQLSPEESVPPRVALDLYTRSAAFAGGEEAIKGTISTGKLADLVLLNANPCRVLPENIKDIKVRMTVLDGDIVYRNF
ncbi:MAG: amidohydrolase [Chloroflexota bacterium]